MKVTSSDLLSIVETDNFQNEISIKLKDIAPCYKNTIHFQDKEQLKMILKNEVEDLDVPYMMYLSESLDCGLIPIPSFNCFNLDFSFYDEHVGIIIFIRIDGKEEFLFDYYIEDGIELLDVEIKKISNI